MFCAVCGNKITDEQIGQKMKVVGTEYKDGKPTRKFFCEMVNCVQCAEKIDHFMNGGEVEASRRAVKMRLEDQGKTATEIEKILEGMKFDHEGNELWDGKAA